MARGFRGVKDDLSELVRHLLDVACFFGPLLAVPANYDSDPNSPNSNSNPDNSNTTMNDLVEFGAGIKCGITRVSSSLKRNSKIINSGVDNHGIIRDEVLIFVKELVKCPESWIEFPVPVDNYFDMSRHQKDHVATVENLAPSLATLRVSLCPSFMTEGSFWKIYFALLHPKLNKLESELLSTQEIMEEMRTNLKRKMQSRANSEIQAETSSSSVTEKTSPKSQEEEKRMQVNITSTSSNAEKDIKAQHDLTQPKATLQYIDRWFDTPVPNITREGDNDALGHRRRQTNNKENDYYTDEDNIAMMRKNRDFSYEHLHVSKKISSDSEASEWQAVSESSDFEILEKS